MFGQVGGRSGAKLLAGMAVVATLALAVVAAGAAFAQPAYADSVGYTATATPYYRNPATGVIEDSGGESSEVLGQSMTEGATYPAAFVELDDAGNRYVTLRLALIDNIKDVSIQADDNWTGSYYQVSYDIVAYDAAAGTADFRFLASDEGAIFRINMYVIPMGRSVIFYVALSDFAEGNPYGFAMVGGSSASSGLADAEAVASLQAPQENLQTQQASTAADAEVGEDSESESDADETVGEDDAGEVSDGLAEYDAEGNKVEADASAADASEGTVSLPVGALAVGAVAVIALAALAGWFFGVYRPRRATPSQAVLAAEAAADGAGSFRPYEHTPEESHADVKN